MVAADGAVAHGQRAKGGDAAAIISVPVPDRRAGDRHIRSKLDVEDTVNDPLPWWAISRLLINGARLDDGRGRAVARDRQGTGDVQITVEGGVLVRRRRDGQGVSARRQVYSVRATPRSAVTARSVGIAIGVPDRFAQRAIPVSSSEVIRRTVHVYGCGVSQSSTPSTERQPRSNRRCNEAREPHPLLFFHCSPPLFDMGAAAGSDSIRDLTKVAVKVSSKVASKTMRNWVAWLSKVGVIYTHAH